MTMISLTAAARAPRSIRLALIPILMMITTALVPLAAQAVTLEQALVRHFPPGSIASVGSAREALARVEPARREAEQAFAAERTRCHDKFFTSSCLSDAKDSRRIVLSNIRKVEVEANAFLRKDKAAERDKVIADRQGRAAQPLEGPSISITGATRDSAGASEKPDQPEKP